MVDAEQMLQVLRIARIGRIEKLKPALRHEIHAEMRDGEFWLRKGRALGCKPVGNCRFERGEVTVQFVHSRPGSIELA